jgi:hypothetical protein
VLQLSQHIALFFVVAAFWHVPHGHLGVLGPGFVSVSEEFAISNRHRYNCTFLLGLYLRYLVAKKQQQQKIKLYVVIAVTPGIT